MLTPRQERFCAEYVTDLNATQAAIRAGYARKYANTQASAMLRKVEVSARVAELKKVAAARTDITQEWVLTRLKDVAERCLQGQPVLVNGEPSGEWRFDAANAIRALEILGKHVGIFGDKGEETCPPPTALRHFRALIGIRDDPSQN